MSDKPLSRSEREAKIKDKAGWAITILAALLAINTLFGNANSSKILNNTIAANDVWTFYQAKSIKQTIYESVNDQITDIKLKEKNQKIIDRYESDPSTGEGKKELMTKAQQLETARSEARKSSPFFTYAGSILQIAIVLLSASILAVNNRMYQASIVIGIIGALLLSQGLWLWLPFNL